MQVLSTSRRMLGVDTYIDRALCFTSSMTRFATVTDTAWRSHGCAEGLSLKLSLVCQVGNIEAKVEPGAGEASTVSQRGISNKSVLRYLTNRNFIHSHVPREECLSDMYLEGH